MMNIKHEKPSEDELIRLGKLRKLFSLHTPGYWMMFPYCYLKFPGFTCIDAIVLSFIMNDQNRYAANPSKYGKYNGWFYYTSSRLTQKLGIPRRTQYKSMEKFKALNIIITKIKGIPPKRHIFINMDVLIDLISKYHEEDLIMIEEETKEIWEEY